ncbi:hypothetical protein BC826DRAFT_1104588 [Russula brevipes]|nr:hypothetical protein BC826DRAFT_1104588 [Russula brevipes]
MWWVLAIIPPPTRALRGDVLASPNEIASRAPNNASTLELPLWNPNHARTSYATWAKFRRAKAQSYYAQWRLRSRPTCIMRRWKEVVKAFARDVRDFVLDFVDPGHFALETHVEYFVKQINKFFSGRCEGEGL